MGGDPKINADALKSEIRGALINQKANACPIAMRLAWHASGTFDKSDNCGGSDGATMRFEPESLDDANAGLSITRDLLLPIKAKHPEVSMADIWALAGCAGCEFLGGPKIDFSFGRTDDADGSKCPMPGRLPDASQGAEHIRDVFGRMGFNDKEMVALSGAHTLGRCHPARSGFDGPWTHNPLKFDNTYYKLLLSMKWVPKQWDGPLQYEDEVSGELMMLPTDLALVTDPEFRKYVEIYAADEGRFFSDFADAFGKLIALGAKQEPKVEMTRKEENSAEFREMAMHGSYGALKELFDEGNLDVHAVERASGRTALHKAAFWGHEAVVAYLLGTCKIDPSVKDYNGDTALHDACRFGGKDTPHYKAVEELLKGGANPSIKNNAGQTCLDVAKEYQKEMIVKILQGSVKSRL